MTVNKTHARSQTLSSIKLVTLILNISVYSALVAVSAPGIAAALPTATNFGLTEVNEITTCACSGSGSGNGSDMDMQVTIPVSIMNLENGPVPGIIFNILYDTDVMRVVEVHNGALTANWGNPVYNNFEWGTRVVLAFDPEHEDGAIPDGASGSVALLVFNVSLSGEPGAWSMLNFSDIQLAEGPPDYLVGTAPPRNGTFSVVRCRLQGQVTDILDTGIGGATVTLRTMEGTLIASTTTDPQGNYWFAELKGASAGFYNLSAVKACFWSSYTTVYINSSSNVTTRADIELLRMGDLNGNGMAADIADVAMMWNAWAGLITADYHYDLNRNGIAADIGDVAMMWNAWKGEITLC